MNRIQPAIIDFKKAIELNKLNSEGVHDNLGWAYIDNNEFEESIKSFDRCLSLQGNHLDAIIGISVAYYSCNRLDLAKKYFENAKTIEPLLNDRNKGILSLEQRGYFYSENQKKIIRKMYKDLNVYDGDKK
jgi:tetratricopeptide (TPR) repeat protein